jgi:hypothetical protein
MELTVAEFVLWVLIGSGTAVLGCALVSRYLHRRTERAGLARRVVCRLCLHAFEDASRDPVVKCPACGALTHKPSSG